MVVPLVVKAHHKKLSHQEVVKISKETAISEKVKDSISKLFLTKELYPSSKEIVLGHVPGSVLTLELMYLVVHIASVEVYKSLIVKQGYARTTTTLTTPNLKSERLANFVGKVGVVVISLPFIV